ncbi:MAG: hypothetical protein ACREPN_07265 [Rudaea sp.]
MWRAVIWLGVIAFAALAHWVDTGLLDALPALIAALIGWLFARSLRAGRTPLIGRAIAAIDGDAWLDDAAVARYARRLTALWAIWQFALSAVAVVFLLHARGWQPSWQLLPSPRLFGMVGLPAAVGALLLAEFFLRPRLLPQAPRHGLFAFLRALIVHWPFSLRDVPVTGDGTAECAMSDTICEHFHIAALHPALPGHFPGNPIVPGVILLERAAAAVTRGFGLRIVGVVQVKFLRPLRAEESCALQLTRAGNRASLRILRGDELVASGTLELAR